MLSCLGLQSTELEGRRLGLLGLQPRPSRWELMKKACYLAGPRKAMSSSTSRLKSSTSLAPPTQQPWWNFFAGTPWGLKGIYSGRGARAPPLDLPLDAPPNGPKNDTRSNGPKDGVAAPWQILDAKLFRRFPLIFEGLLM